MTYYGSPASQLIFSPILVSHNERLIELGYHIPYLPILFSSTDKAMIGFTLYCYISKNMREIKVL